jgi:translation initiation factor IF-2
MSRRQDGGYIRPPDPVDPKAPPATQPPAQADGKPATPGTEAPRTGGRRTGVPGTSATVVRMIDRDKLLERVPGRRLGGAPAGPGAPRYGQVTELKVVTDPFGRGREMVAVGANKRKGPAGPVPGAGRGAPGGARKGRGGKRDMNDMRERALHPTRLKRKKSGSRSAKKTEVTQPRASKRVIRMKETIVVADLAHQLGAKSVDLIRKLMAMGSMVTQNQAIDFDTAQLLAAEFDFTVDSVAFAEDAVIAQGVAEDVDADANVSDRPPVVTVMGHVDHGKTSLLDAIRKAKVASGEAGGITQHIGAYSVPVAGKGTVTFLDTPGHAAFTSMRARGAQVTDLVVLVVAADDGVMPQTEEAIRHAQAAKVPIIVAVNKIDKPDANADRVMQELTKFELLPEAWGGETLYVNTSATQGTGIDELLETILLQAEVLELRANPDRPAIGVVVEAQLDRGRGPVATVLVKQGTLKRGDAIVVGCASGKIRAMMDHTGKLLDAAGPSTAVEITGLDAVPDAGDVLNVVESAESARDVAHHRLDQKRSQEAVGPGNMSLDDLMRRMQGQSGLELKLVLKADVQGSVEAVKGALIKLSTDEVKVNVIYGGVGAISESDIMLAAASGGLVLGFGVRPDTNARIISEREGVEVRTYSIIYEAIDDVRKAMEGLLTPESREKIVGRAEVRDLFKVSKVGTIGGCRVTEGKAARSARVRVLRDSVQVYEGKTSSLRHFKNDVREVETGLECGIGVEGYNDLKAGDVLEFFTIEEVARTLSSAPLTTKRGQGGYDARP